MVWLGWDTRTRAGFYHVLFNLELPPMPFSLLVFCIFTIDFSSQRAIGCFYLFIYLLLSTPSSNRVL